MNETTGRPEEPPGETRGRPEQPPAEHLPVLVPRVLSPALKTAGQVAKQAVEGARRTQVKATKFTLGAIVCLLLGTFIAPYLGMSVIMAALFFYPLMFIGGGVVGMVVIPMDDVFTTREELALKRAKLLHKEQTRVLDEEANRLQDGGHTPQEIETQQRDQRKQIDQQLLQVLDDLRTPLTHKKNLQIGPTKPE